MPSKPLKACSVPGCGGRALRRGRCEQHAKQYERGRPSAAKRGYDREWREIRAEHLAMYPFCVVCGLPATDVDHIVPRAQGGSSEHSNLQSLCHTHHSRKTILSGINPAR